MMHQTLAAVNAALERAVSADSPWRYAEALSDLVGELASAARAARAECQHAWQVGSAGWEWSRLARILESAEKRLETQYQEMRPLGLERRA